METDNEKEIVNKDIKAGFGEQRKKMIRKKAEIVIKSKVPNHIEKILSWIEYDVGITRDTAKAILIMLHDIGKITIDKDTDMVYWGNRSEIPQGNQGEKD